MRFLKFLDLKTVFISFVLLWLWVKVISLQINC